MSYPPDDDWRFEIEQPHIKESLVQEDPSRSKIVFTRSEESGFNAEGFAEYGVFVGENYLGNIDLIDPLRMICDRSPGGNQIAFAEWNFYAPVEESKIFWFDLDQLQLSSIEIPPLAVHWIGFSPDERHLAVSGFSDEEGMNRFVMVDTEEATIRTLPISANFNRITWNPDGTQILILEEDSSSFDPVVKRRIKIHSAVDSKLIERIDVEDFSATRDTLSIPMDGWTAEFQNAIQDITSCTAAPAE